MDVSLCYLSLHLCCFYVNTLLKVGTMISEKGFSDSERLSTLDKCMEHTSFIKDEAKQSMCW